MCVGTYICMYARARARARVCVRVCVCVCESLEDEIGVGWVSLLHAPFAVFNTVEDRLDHYGPYNTTTTIRS